MAKYSIDSATLTGIADAIREKAGTTDSILTSAMADAIASIPEGAKVYTGSLLVNSITNEISFTHNLGVIPTFVAVFQGDVSSAGETGAMTYISGQILLGMMASMESGSRLEWVTSQRQVGVTAGDWLAINNPDYGMVTVTETTATFNGGAMYFYNDLPFTVFAAG